VWAVDFYDSATFDPELRNALRSNKLDVFLPASDGDLMAALMHTWQNLSAANRQTYAQKPNFDQFCEAIGYQQSARPRLTTLLHNRTISNIVAQFVGTTYGREVFTLSSFDKVVASRLDRVRIAYIIHL